MLNNKGFAVTAVLYTLLIAFLMFLGAALAMFSSSSRIIGNANDDLINGSALRAYQVKSDCDNDGDIDSEDEICWNTSNIIVKINSRYGTMYWPRDFCTNNNGVLSCEDENSSVNGQVTAQCLSANSGTQSYTNCNGVDISSRIGATDSGEETRKFLLITDNITNETQTLDIYNVYE